MSVSVIVSNLNGGKYLPRLLATLRAQRRVELQIIVVDRHSTDDSAALLQAESGITVLHHAPETGLASGYHVGAQAATGEHLFFCNEDMWFDEDCLWQLEQQIDLGADIAAADPWQWSYDGAHWLHGGVRFERCRFTMLSPYPFRRMRFTEDLPAGTEIPFSCAGAVLIHRRVYEQVGGWAADFFLDLEDVDLSIRMWQCGWKSVTVPGARVFHAVNASNIHTLAATQQTVSRRRYVSGRASASIVGIKYFTGLALLAAPVLFAAEVIKNLVRLKFSLLKWDAEIGAQIVTRTRAAWRYRRAHVAQNRKMPGQRWFTTGRFNV